MNFSDSQKKAALSGCVTRTAVEYLPEPYRGKVRDVYKLPENRLAIVATDRISAFDHILRQPIPYKGQILNTLAAHFFGNVSDLVETHVLEVPHPNITIARACDPLPVEVVVRGYLVGHAWREYKSGKRELCGVPLPEGMSENQRFDHPILTPATKATEGHDEDISEREILNRGLVGAERWEEIREKAFLLFERGQEIALRHGLLLADTKYEFGIFEDRLILIDEVHTPDSSRYFYAGEYEERFSRGEHQNQLSKEFIREWLMSRGFQGKEGQSLPDMSDEFRWQVYQRYAELFNAVTGKTFEPTSTSGFNEDLARLLRPYV